MGFRYAFLYYVPVDHIPLRQGDLRGVVHLAHISYMVHRRKPLLTMLYILLLGGTVTVIFVVTTVRTPELARARRLKFPDIILSHPVFSRTPWRTPSYTDGFFLR